MIWPVQWSHSVRGSRHCFEYPLLASFMLCSCLEIVSGHFGFISLISLVDKRLKKYCSTSRIALKFKFNYCLYNTICLCHLRLTIGAHSFATLFHFTGDFARINCCSQFLYFSQRLVIWVFSYCEAKKNSFVNENPFLFEDIKVVEISSVFVRFTRS